VSSVVVFLCSAAEYYLHCGRSNAGAWNEDHDDNDDYDYDDDDDDDDDDGGRLLRPD